MKHKKIHTDVLNLIKLREQQNSNLPTAENHLLELIKKDPECAWAHGLIGQICYWRGEVAPPADRLNLYKRGIEYGERGVELDEDSLESNFWLAVNYGLYGNERGPLESMKVIDPIERHLQKAKELDESYFYGAPLRALGRFYNQLPGWPLSRGDNKKSLKHLQEALEHGPKFYLNHIYIADTYLSLKQKDKAKEHLQWVIKAPLSPQHEREDARDKEVAQKMLKNL